MIGEVRDLIEKTEAKHRERFRELEERIRYLESGQDMSLVRSPYPHQNPVTYPQTVRSVVYQLLDHLGLKQEPVKAVQAGGRLVPKDPS